ncbi:MAG: LTA synthase family protein [Bacteroidia bacterium]|nr:LTA synthase family protein [Bacteroidia bacterium]
MVKIIQSRLIRFLFAIGLFFLALLLLLRFIFHFAFTPVGETQVAKSFVLGFRYDARVVCFFLMILLLLGSFRFFRPFSNKLSRGILFFLIYFFASLIIIFYTFDFAHFAYLRQRLNASVLNYAEDAKISATMIWQSYPVIKILFAWIICFTGIYYINRFIYRVSNRMHEYISKRNLVLSYVISFFIFAVAIFGRVGQFPLRWSDAYRLNNDYKASLSLNPFQSFFSSLKFRKSGYDIKKTKQYYNLMATQLGVMNPDTSTLNFIRTSVVSDSAVSRHPNIVLVICESFCAYKSSMWGNPLNTTPYFNELCNKGIFFKNCFSPAYGTARGIWAIVTGIPDVTELRTASRNPKLVDQRTILNDMPEYDKFYFMGGSASWANIRGMLSDNIKGLHLYEQGDYKSKTVDVWGISDKNLFLEANNILRQQPPPFFAIIQTADNHRPYTIPKEDRAFIKTRSFPNDTLKEYGFWSNEELNAYSYMDYTFKTFFDAAENEKYFNNTIFVFVGDHGLGGDAGKMFPKVWTEQGLTNYHVPLLFYAPSLLKPQVLERKVSQIDILPSIAGLAGISIKNFTLGRNIFADNNVSDSSNLKNIAYVIDPWADLTGIITEKYYYEYNLHTKKENVYSLLSTYPLQPGDPDSEYVNKMRDLTIGYYETSRYMLFNNKKKK